MSGVLTAVSVIGTAASIVNSQKQAKEQEKAAKQAQANADRQAREAEQANNRANQKRANTGAALDNATQAGKAGASGTMLTGSQGIDASLLNLSKSTLLGS